MLQHVQLRLERSRAHDVQRANNAAFVRPHRDIVTVRSSAERTAFGSNACSYGVGCWLREVGSCLDNVVGTGGTATAVDRLAGTARNSSSFATQPQLRRQLEPPPAMFRGQALQATRPCDPWKKSPWFRRLGHAVTS
ncbi:unnamed protein product [Ectocarpus sp. 12 AP-2014]